MFLNIYYKNKQIKRHSWVKNSYIFYSLHDKLSFQLIILLAIELLKNKFRLKIRHTNQTFFKPKMT